MITAKHVLEEMSRLDEGKISSFFKGLLSGKGKGSKEAKIAKSGGKPVCSNIKSEIEDNELFMTFIIDFKEILDADWDKASEDTVKKAQAWFDSFNKEIEKLVEGLPNHLSDKVTDETWIKFNFSVIGKKTTKKDDLVKIYKGVTSFFDKTCAVEGKVPEEPTQK